MTTVEGKWKLQFNLLSITTGQLLSLTCMLNNKLPNDAAASRSEVTDVINGALNIHPHTSSSSMHLHPIEQQQSSEEGRFLSGLGEESTSSASECVYLLDSFINCKYTQIKAAEIVIVSISLVCAWDHLFSVFNNKDYRNIGCKSLYSAFSLRSFITLFKENCVEFLCENILTQKKLSNCIIPSEVDDWLDGQKDWQCWSTATCAEVPVVTFKAFWSHTLKVLLLSWLARWPSIYLHWSTFVLAKFGHIYRIFRTVKCTWI